MAIRRRNLSKSVGATLIRDQVYRGSDAYVYVPKEKMDISRMYDGRIIRGVDLTVEENDIFNGNVVSRDANALEESLAVGDAVFDANAENADQYVFDANSIN